MLIAVHEGELPAAEAVVHFVTRPTSFMIRYDEDVSVTTQARL